MEGVVIGMLAVEEHFERRNAYFEQRQYQKAIKEYVKAVKFDPKYYKILPETLWRGTHSSRIVNW